MLTKKAQYKLVSLMLYIAGGMTLLTSLLSFSVRAGSLEVSPRLLVSAISLLIITVSCFLFGAYMAHKGKRSPHPHRGRYGGVMLPIGLSLLLLSSLSA